MDEVNDRKEYQRPNQELQQLAAGEDAVVIPLPRLLDCFRYYLDRLHELTDLLGPETVAEFADQLQSLTEKVCPQAVADPAVHSEYGNLHQRHNTVQPEIQALLNSVQRNPDSIRRMNNLPEAVLLAAVERMGTAIKHIPNPSERVQMAAVRRNPWAVKRIKNPTPEVVAYAIEKAPELRQYFRRLEQSRQESKPMDDKTAE
ncbi:MAG: hypothetical protein ACOX2K_07015 [Bacillota bacterium]|jgi:hypothetical protein